MRELRERKKEREREQGEKKGEREHKKHHQLQLQYMFALGDQGHFFLLSNEESYLSTDKEARQTLPSFNDSIHSKYVHVKFGNI